MYYISRLYNNKYGIIDTSDNIEEFYTKNEILGMDLPIKGVKNGYIRPYRVNLDLGFELTSAYFFDEYNGNSIAVNIRVYGNKLLEYAKQFYSEIEDNSFGVELLVEDNIPEFTSFEIDLNGAILKYSLFYRSGANENLYIPYKYSLDEEQRLFGEMDKAVKVAENNFRAIKKRFGYSGVAFKGCIMIDDNGYVHMKNTPNLKCKKDTLIMYFKKQYDRVYGNCNDKHVTLYDFLNNLEMDWLEIYIKQCVYYELTGNFC